jgi:hypothetical protein
MASDGVHLGDDIVNFYTEKLKNFGNSAQGVGWKNDFAQDIRFAQLARIITPGEHFSINDLGCGTGKFFLFLKQQGFAFTFNGYDILEEMISTAASLNTDPQAHFFKIRDPREMIRADYTVGSGIFNIKYGVANAEWTEHVLATIGAMNDKSNLGFSFNCLTKYSDREFMQEYLYYADPLFLFDYCKTNFSPNVALLHDYGQYDFTILVRKNI